MSSVGGIQRAIFGAVTPDEVRSWLDTHVRTHLGVAVETVTFQAGDIGAVFGLRLSDGRDVVLKAQRPGCDVRRLRAVVAVQKRLSSADFGCSAVLDGPSSTAGVLAIVEQRLADASTGSPHDDAARAAMAGGLAVQIEIVRSMDGSALIAGRPGWANWDSGAWPVPHDPIFDFTTPVAGYEWVDTTADNAARVLRDSGGTPVIGHSDWVWQNVCIRNGDFVAAYDWDSLIYAPECAVVGLVAGCFTQGSLVAPDAPSAAEVAEFVDDYQAACGRRFDRAEQQTARAAAAWVRCYNARCQLDNLDRRNLAPPAGSFIDQLRAER